jgi:hypothetical protein
VFQLLSHKPLCRGAVAAARGGPRTRSASVRFKASAVLSILEVEPRALPRYSLTKE